VLDRYDFNTCLIQNFGMVNVKFRIQDHLTGNRTQVKGRG